MAATFNALSDTDLARMTDAAWREAARSWGEARRATGSIKPLLVAAAESADAYWRDLRDEQDARLEEAATDGIGAEPGVEDTSTSLTYEVQPEHVTNLADGGTTTLAEPTTKSPATSPWVRAAARHELPARVEGGVPQPKAVR